MFGPGVWWRKTVFSPSGGATGQVFHGRATTTHAMQKVDGPASAIRDATSVILSSDEQFLFFVTDGGLTSRENIGWATFLRLRLCGEE